MKDENNMILRDQQAAYEAPPAQMVRTQIYLSRAEHEFLQKESARLDKPMAGIIRDFIDEKMNVPAGAWKENPLLEPTPVDSEFEGRPDSALNHDHYAYGAPKTWVKRGGKWARNKKA